MMLNGGTIIRSSRSLRYSSRYYHAGDDSLGKSGDCPPLSVFYVYVLKLSKSGQLYIGFTTDLKRRFREHADQQSEYTSHRGPVKLVYYEAYTSENDARKREKVLKQFKGSYGHLRKRLKDSVDES